MPRRQRQVEAVLTASDRQLRRDLFRARRHFQNFSRNVQSEFRGIGIAAGAAFAAAGAGTIAFTRNAIELERSLTRITTLVGRTAEVVAGYRDSIRDISAATGTGLQEQADALFNIESAGFQGAASLELLEQSARASALGLGNQQAIITALTSSIQNYGQNVLSASSATDTFVETVRLGNLVPEELTRTFSQVVPFAAALGVELNEVGAAIATVSQTIPNASRQATTLQGVLRTFIRPSQQAVDTLAEFGISADSLRESLADRGLLTTLQDLFDITGGNIATLGRIFQDTEGLAGALALMASEGEIANRIFTEMGDTSGALQRSFGQLFEDTGFQVDRAVASFNVLADQIGSQLSPIVREIAIDFQEWVENLEPERIEEFANTIRNIGQRVADAGRFVAEHVHLVDDLVIAYIAFRGLRIAGEFAALISNVKNLNVAMAGLATVSKGLTFAAPIAAVGLFAVGITDLIGRIRELNQELETIRQTPIGQLSDEEFSRIRGPQRSPGQRIGLDQEQVEAAYRALLQAAETAPNSPQIREAFVESARALGEQWRSFNTSVVEDAEMEILTAVQEISSGGETVAGSLIDASLAIQDAATEFEGLQEIQVSRAPPSISAELRPELCRYRL